MLNFTRDSLWNAPMKWIAIIFFYGSTFLPIPIAATLLDPSEVLYFAEINDYKALCHSFDNDQTSCIEDAREFLAETFAVIQSHYPSDISLYALKTKIVEVIKEQTTNKNSFEKLKPILMVTIDRLVPNEENFCVILIKSPLKNPTSEIEVPSCLVFGGAELICGALLWLTPFKPLSVVLISDGMRRIGNAVEEKDRELREHPERQYHPPPYNFRER